MLIVRPFLEKLEVAFNCGGRAGSQWKAVACVLDRSRCDLLETHRAPSLENRQRSVESARNHGGIETFAVEGLIPCSVPIDRGAFGCPTLPDDCCDLAATAGKDEDEPFATQAVQILLDDAADEHRGDAGVKRVAAFQENFEGRGSRQRMSRRHRGRAADDRRTLRDVGRRHDCRV